MQLMSMKIGLLSVPLLKTCVRKKGEAPQTLTRSYYFEPPLSKKRSRATENWLPKRVTHKQATLFFFSKVHLVVICSTLGLVVAITHISFI